MGLERVDWDSIVLIILPCHIGEVLDRMVFKLVGDVGVGEEGNGVTFLQVDMTFINRRRNVDVKFIPINLRNKTTISLLDRTFPKWANKMDNIKNFNAKDEMGKIITDANDIMIGVFAAGGLLSSIRIIP